MHETGHETGLRGAREWLRLALRRDVAARALRVALLVGTVLMLINHGDALLAGTLTVGGLVKAASTYCVPYAVSTWSSVQTLRARAPPPQGAPGRASGESLASAEARASMPRSPSARTPSPRSPSPPTSARSGHGSLDLDQG